MLRRYEFHCPKCCIVYEGEHKSDSPCPQCGKAGIRKFTVTPLYHPSRSDLAPK